MFCLAYLKTSFGDSINQMDFDAISFSSHFYLTTMKASSQVVLIAHSLYFDDPTVKVDSVKEYVLFFIYIIVNYTPQRC